MNAGILTFHKANNYGAVLQAYALQKTLAVLGTDSAFIDFCGLPEVPSAAAPGGGPSAFAEKLRAGGASRAALFDAFRERYLQCAAPVPVQEAEGLNEQYDVFIAGSDQIWNAQLPEADGRYFLPFAAPEKRISYAASFGTDHVPAPLKERYARQLAEFRAISVREEQGRRLVRELTGRDCAVSLDPVLLLDGRDWEALAAPWEGEPYLFLYMVGYDGQLAARARQEAERQGLPLRTVTAGFMPQYGLQAWNGTGVEQWLSLIRNAAGVFTNSFHCTAFSMIFGRPVSLAPLKDGLASRNGRLTELLRLAGAEDETVVPASDLENRLRDRKLASLEYLSNALKH